MIKYLKFLFSFQNILLICYIFIMTYFLYMRDVNEVNINKFIFALIVILASILSNTSTLIAIILFTIPLMCGLPGNFFLPVWILLIALHFLRNKNRSFLPPFWLATFFILFEIFHYIWYDFENNYIEVASYYCSLLLIFTLCYSNLKIDYTRSVLAFCIGCCVLLTIIFMMFIKGGDAAMMVEMSGRMGGDKVYAGDEIMTLRTNPNTIGLFSSTSIACALALFYYKRFHFITLILIVFLCFVCGLFSVSRTWVLVLCLMVILYLFFQHKSKWVGYVTVGLLLLSFIFFYLRNPEIVALFLNRFTDSSIQTGGNRTVLFEAYNNFMFDNLIYMLWGTSAQFYKDVTGIFNSTHNGIQQIFICYGIIGVIILLGVYVRLLVRNYTHRQQMAVLPMICVFIFLQTLQSLWPITCLYPIIAAFFVMKIVKQDTRVVPINQQR